MEEKKKKWTNNPFVIVLLVGLTIFQIVRMVNNVDDISQKSASNKANTSEKRIADSLDRISPIRTYKASSAFVAEDNSFILPIMTELDMVKEMITNEILFIGVSKSVIEDKAGLIVQKIQVDTTTTLSLVDQWQAHENKALKDNPVANVYLPEGEIVKKDKYSIVNIKSKDGARKGIMRLQRKGSFLYIVKGISLSEKWADYDGSFSFSIKSFILR
jgi:hypothetical protein